MAAVVPSSLVAVVVEVKDAEAVNDEGNRRNHDHGNDHGADRDRILFRHHDDRNDRDHLSARSDRMRTVNQTDEMNRSSGKGDDRDDRDDRDDHVRRQRLEVAAVEAVVFGTEVVVHRYIPS